MNLKGGENIFFPIDNNCYYDYVYMKQIDQKYKFPSLKPT
jgi:hypothetical protein